MELEGRDNGAPETCRYSIAADGFFGIRRVSSGNIYKKFFENC